MSEKNLHIAAQSFVGRDSPVQSRWRLVKRALDLIIAIPCFVLLLPFFGVIALLIKVDSRGPTFFVHERLGAKGKPFKCVKFRSMYVDSDNVLRQHLHGNPVLDEEWATYKKLQNDPRVTRVGRILRRLTIDELPQILNIIKGEMSIIGPRPYLPRELPGMGPYSEVILCMRPGMAGIWVAQGRNELTFQERISLEANYVSNWSFQLDCVLFIQSVKAVLSRRGAC